MKRLCIIIFLILLLPILLIWTDKFGSHLAVKRARTLRIGDSKKRVEQILGHPVSTFSPLPQARTNFVAALLSVRSETWAYGSRLELHHAFAKEFPYFCPVRLRLFSPDADDVAIEFD